MFSVLFYLESTSLMQDLAVVKIESYVTAKS